MFRFALVPSVVFLLVAGLLCCGCSDDAAERTRGTAVEEAVTRQDEERGATPAPGSGGSDLLREAKRRLSSNDHSGALRLAIQVLEKQARDVEAQAIVDEVARNHLVVLSQPSGLPVFIAPLEALKEPTRDSDEKTPLAEAYEKSGVPRVVGSKSFAIGATPIATSEPKEEVLVCVVKRAKKGQEIEAKRSLAGHAMYSGYGKISMRLTAGGFRPYGGTFLLWDDNKQRSGQVQIVEDGSFRVVIRCVSYSARGEPLEVRFASDDLYEPILKHDLPHGALR